MFRKERCDQCRYYVERGGGGGVGLCHRHPPAVLKIGEQSGIGLGDIMGASVPPEVPAHMCCGDGSPK